MSINLKKGERVDLTKDTNMLESVRVAVGWDEATSKRLGKEEGIKTSKGLFGKLKSAVSQLTEEVKAHIPIDCDVAMLMLDENGRLKYQTDVVYFGRLQSNCGSVRLSGDNLTGEGAGDDETIYINLKKVPSYVHRLLAVVTIYQCEARGQHFGMIQNAFARVVDDRTGKEMVRYNLSDNYDGKTAVKLCELRRKGTGWEFIAIGDGTNDTSLTKVVNKYL